MPDTKISGLAELTVQPATDDLLVLVDVSDTSMASTGTDKKIQFSNTLPVGSVVQTVESTVTTEVTTSATAVPAIPFTVSNGDALMSAAITPYYSNSKIRITANGFVSVYKNASGTGSGVIWLCASGTTNWLNDVWVYGYSDGATVHWILRHTHTPGAGARTYTLRMSQGSSIASGVGSFSMYINGFNFVSGGYKPITTLTLQEVKQ